MAYQILTADNRMVLVDQASGLRVQVEENKGAEIAAITAYILATLYRVRGGFVPEKVFVFRALTETSLETLKKAADFFFCTLLETELYVKEVPPDSVLFAEEAVRIYGKQGEEVSYGTTGHVCTSRAE